MNPYQIRIYNSKDVEQVTNFWGRNHYFKETNPSTLRKHLLWKYNKRFAKIWVAKKGIDVVGSCGRLITKLLLNGKIVGCGAWGLDSLVDRNLGKKERRCIFLRVFRKALLEGYRKDTPEIVFSFPNEVVRDTYLRIGWLDIPTFFKFYRQINIGYANDFNQKNNKINFILIKKFNREWDKLWKTFSSGFSLSVLRESPYLNWRYFHNPNKKYLVFLGKSKNKIKGYIVLKEEPRLGKKIGHIVDFCVDPQDKKIYEAFISKSILFLAHRGCAAIDSHLSSARHKGTFLNLGFTMKKIDLFIFCRFPALLKKILKKKSEWFITAGDGDFEMEED